MSTAEAEKKNVNIHPGSSVSQVFFFKEKGNRKIANQPIYHKHFTPPFCFGTLNFKERYLYFKL